MRCVNLWKRSGISCTFKTLPRNYLFYVSFGATFILVGYGVYLTHWRNDLGQPPGVHVGLVDFAGFWASAILVMQGHGVDAYHWSKLQKVLESTFRVSLSRGLPVYYPPSFLLLLAPLACLTYRTAFALWTILGLGVFTAASLGASNGRVGPLVAALAAPGVLGAVVIGQNGLFTAAVLGGGLALLDRRPLLAGVILSLLVCKPQLALLTPIALAASGRWRVLTVAAISAALLAIAAGLILGWQAYAAFFHAGREGSTVFAAAGPVAWSKVQTIYGLGRVFGAPAAIAVGSQVVVSIACALGIWRVWSGSWPFALKAACLVVATLLATPYAFVYDSPLLGIGLAFLLTDATERPPMSAGQALATAFFAIIPLTWLSGGIPTVPLASAGLLALVILQAHTSMAVQSFSTKEFAGASASDSAA